MAKKVYELTANVSTENPQAVRRVLEDLVEKGSITPIGDGFQIKAKMVGESARDLNRTLLSALRKVEKRTRLRAEWAFGKSVERFFDYVPKGVRRG
jgi:DNA-binding IclR family transcriptional regulator